MFNFVTHEGPLTNAAANLVQLSTLSNSRCSSPEETELLYQVKIVIVNGWCYTVNIFIEFDL